MKFLSPMLSILIFAGCRERSLVTIDISESATTQISGVGPLGDVTDLIDGVGFQGFTDMNIVESEELANQGVSPGDIKEARLVGFTLTVETPENGDLSFIDEMDVLIGSEGLPTEKVAYQYEFVGGQRTVSFNLIEVDLTGYVVSESLSITTDVVGRLPSDDTTITADVTLSVGVTVQGAKNAVQHSSRTH